MGKYCSPGKKIQGSPHLFQFTFENILSIIEKRCSTKEKKGGKNEILDASSDTGHCLFHRVRQTYYPGDAHRQG
jgi:hypothetical protein